jgi:hypothetical protein
MQEEQLGNERADAAQREADAQGQAKLADAQAKADRERLADWFATYHSVNEELRQAGTEIPENPDNPDQPDENGGNEVPEDMDGGSY